MNTNPTPQPQIKTTTTLTNSIKSLLDLQNKLEGKWLATADTLRAEAEANNYDKDQAREMLALAFEQAKQDRKKKAPDISKILLLAYPKSEQTKDEIAKAREHNTTAPASKKIGVNQILEIARGNTTVEQILTERKKPKGSSTGTRKASKPSMDDLGNACVALIQHFHRNGFTFEQIQDQFTYWLAEQEIQSAPAIVAAEQEIQATPAPTENAA